MECEMTGRTCAACAEHDGGARTADGFTTGSHDATCGYRHAGRAGGGKAGMGAECPDCGGRTGRIDKGDAPACGNGGPPMRGAGYHRRHRGPTAISPEKCEQKEVDHD